MAFELVVEHPPGLTVARLTGRIDSVAAPRLANDLSQGASWGSTTLILDFAAVDYISSAGLTVLMNVAAALGARGGRVALCGPSEAVLEVFRLAGVLSTFEVEATREAAIARLCCTPVRGGR